MEFLKPYYEMILAQQEDGVCQDYATLKTSSLHYSGAFAQGNVAMMNMGSWFIPTLIEKIKTGEYGSEVANWGLVKYPHAEGVEPGSTLATITCLSIPTSAPHKDLAWEFVKFVCGSEGAEVVAQTGTIPAITNDAWRDSRLTMPARRLLRQPTLTWRCRFTRRALRSRPSSMRAMTTS